MSDQSQLFIHHKAYNTTQSDFGSLFLPSDAFLHFCNVCETVFRKEFSDENMRLTSICYRINRAIHQQASYKELSVRLLRQK